MLTASAGHKATPMTSMPRVILWMLTRDEMIIKFHTKWSTTKPHLLASGQGGTGKSHWCCEQDGHSEWV